MTDYHVVFNVYLIPEKMPDRWTSPVEHVLDVRVDTLKQLRGMIDAEYATFINHQGLMILEDTGKSFSADTASMDRRRFLPMHMIEYIQTRITLVSTGVREDEEEGSRGGIN
jgi:hypothetical protein